MRAFAAAAPLVSVSVIRRKAVEYLAMTFARTHQSLIAWMLYGFILFSALACSISHGQMLGAFNQLNDAATCGEHHAASGNSGMSDMSEHARVMKLAMTDCAFAGTLALSLVFFIGLSWLAGSIDNVLPRLERVRKKPPRYSLVGRLPQAP